MSSSSLAFLNSFTLEEKQNRTPGDSYTAKPWPDEGKGITIPSEVKNQDKNPLEDWRQKKLLLNPWGKYSKRKTWPFLKLCSASRALNTKQNRSLLRQVTCESNVLILGRVNWSPSFPVSLLGPPLMPGSPTGGESGKLHTHLLRFWHTQGLNCFAHRLKTVGILQPSGHLHGSTPALAYCGVFPIFVIPYLPPIHLVTLQDVQVTSPVLPDG